MRFTRMWLDNVALIKSYCFREELATFDPYDVWTTQLGCAIKNLFNHVPWIGAFPAAILAVSDLYLNNSLRLFYKKRDYPIVRALAALSLLTLYKEGQQEDYLRSAKRHLDWLVAHACIGYSGACWGLGFRWAVAANLIYDEQTPFVTATPYPLEAFVMFQQVTGDNTYKPIIRGVYRFLEQDIQVMCDDGISMAVSYGPSKDRLVTNATSYAMYSYTLLSPYLDETEKARAAGKINRLYQFIRNAQRENGSWLYALDGRSFIDCFHSCIILKNLIKTHRLHTLPEVEAVVERGYCFLKDALWDDKRGLVRRFAAARCPSLVKYDLYDNAEMLNLAILMGDRVFGERLAKSISLQFVRDGEIYSVIEVTGHVRNKNMLRWAVMPYLFALSQANWGSPGFVDTPKGKGIIPWEVCHGGRTKEVHEGIQG